MMRALKYASAFDMLLMQHPEEKSLSQSGSMNSGALSTKLGIKGIPEEAEVIQVDRDLRLAEMTNGKIHFLNISTGLAIDAIQNAQKKGLKVIESKRFQKMKHLNSHLIDEEIHELMKDQHYLDKLIQLLDMSDCNLHRFIPQLIDIEKVLKNLNTEI